MAHWVPEPHPKFTQTFPSYFERNPWSNVACVYTGPLVFKCCLHLRTFVSLLNAYLSTWAHDQHSVYAFRTQTYNGFSCSEGVVQSMLPIQLHMLAALFSSFGRKSRSKPDCCLVSNQFPVHALCVRCPISSPSTRFCLPIVILPLRTSTCSHARMGVCHGSAFAQLLRITSNC